jgi:hypothetical protein
VNSKPDMDPLLKDRHKRLTNEKKISLSRDVIEEVKETL